MTNQGIIKALYDAAISKDFDIVEDIIDAEIPDFMHDDFFFKQQHPVTGELKNVRHFGQYIMSYVAAFGSTELMSKIIACSACPKSRTKSSVELIQSSEKYKKLSAESKFKAVSKPGFIFRFDSVPLLQAVRSKRADMVQLILAHSCASCAPGVSVSQAIVNESIKLNGVEGEITTALQARL